MRRLAIAFSVTLLSSCSGNGGGGGGGPKGPIAVRDVWSESGERRASAAQCLGFTIEAREDGVTFGTDAAATLGDLALPVAVVDETHLRVGEETTGRECFFLPVFLASHGELALTVSGATGSWTLEKAITLEPADAVDVGFVEKERVWAAGELDGRWDVDVYRATFTDAYHVYDDVDFFGEGGPLVPELELWSDAHPESYLGRGGVGLVFPQNGTQLVVVRETAGATGAYDIGFAGDELGSTQPADDCDDPDDVPLATARAIHADYDDLHDDFDPDGACTDSIYGTPIKGGGADGVWRVRVPAGAELRVSSYDDHLDSVLWIMDPADGCPRVPTCLAAAGRFGGGNTDTLVWVNESGAERELFLVHDAVREPDLLPGEDEVGSFLLDVEIFD